MHEHCRREAIIYGLGLLTGDSYLITIVTQ